MRRSKTPITCPVARTAGLSFWAGADGGMILDEAEADQADLRRANLRGAQGLTRAHIDNTVCDADTRLPDDVTEVPSDGG